jgi:thymidylate synthase
LESRKVKKTKKINLEIVMKNNIEHQYLKLLKDILDNGVTKQDRTGTGTLSVFGRQIRHDMKLGFPLLTTKKIYWKGIVTELLWFLQGRTDLRFLLENGCHIWTGDAYRVYDIDFDREHPAFSGPYPKRLTKEEFETKIMEDDEFNKWYGDLGSIYGKQWRSWKGKLVDKSEEFNAHTAWVPEQIDQIQNLINDLKTNPDSRRLMVNAWNVGELDQMVLPPCHYGFQVYTRELSLEERSQYKRGNKETYPTSKWRDDMGISKEEYFNQIGIPTRAISLMWNQRSVDTFLGLPFNIASYGLLLELIAKAVNMVPDELIGNLGDTHLYSNHIEQAREQLTREPYPLPILNINTEWWPTESGECGVGPIDAAAVFHPDNVHFYKSLLEEDLQLGNYQAHPHIKAPLSN